MCTDSVLSVSHVQRFFSHLRWTLFRHGLQRCSQPDDERCVLYWGNSVPPPAILRRLRPDCRVLHFPHFTELSHKERLTVNVERQRRRHERRQRRLGGGGGGRLFPAIPQSFLLPDQLDEWAEEHRKRGGRVHGEVEQLIAAVQQRHEGRRDKLGLKDAEDEEGRGDDSDDGDEESSAYHGAHCEVTSVAASRPPLWILKPRHLGSGRQICVTDLQSPSPPLLHALSRPFIAQRYIDRPLLIDGRKVDLRLYVALLSSLQPPITTPCPATAALYPSFPYQVYLYEDGLMRLASSPYPVDSTSLSLSLSSPFIHLTNNSISRQVSPSQGQLQNRSWRDWLAAVREGGGEGETTGRAVASSIQQSIERCVLSALACSSSFLAMGRSPPHSHHFDLLGVDVVLDDCGAAWLCEVNSMPDLLVAASPHSTVYPVDLQVKRGVISGLLTLLQLPRDDHQHDQRDDDEVLLGGAVDSSASRPHHVGGFRRLV